MDNKNIGIIVAVAVVAAGGGFFGGMKYEQSKTPAGGITAAQRQQFAAQRGTGAGAGQRRGGGFTAGQVISKDDKSVTVKLQSGGSTIVFYSPTTQIEKPATVDPTQLTVGEMVTVIGAPNSDGSINAQSIQIRPNMPAQGTTGGQSGGQAPTGQAIPGQ